MSSTPTTPPTSEDIAPPREDIAQAEEVITQLIIYAHAKARTLHDAALAHPVARLPALARAFNRVARTVRRSILLIQQLALILAHNLPFPTPQPRRPNTPRPETAERPESVELPEIVERPESVERIERPYSLRTHTLPQIIARIRRELGLKPGEGPTFDPSTTFHPSTPQPPTPQPPEPTPQTPEPRLPPGEPHPTPIPGNAATPPRPNPEPDG